jgi:hypothetical protein
LANGKQVAQGKGLTLSAAAQENQEVLIDYGIVQKPGAEYFLNSQVTNGKNNGVIPKGHTTA